MEFFVRNNGEGISIQNGDWVSVGRILNGGQLNAIPFYSYTDFSPQTVGPELAVSEYEISTFLLLTQRVVMEHPRVMGNKLHLVTN